MAVVATRSKSLRLLSEVVTATQFAVFATNTDKVPYLY
jgi:hypothetical protein